MLFINIPNKFKLTLPDRTEANCVNRGVCPTGDVKRVMVMMMKLYI